MTVHARRAADLLGATARDATALRGGMMAEIERVTLTDGSTIVAKSGATARDEAAMLRSLDAAGVPAPQVLSVRTDLLVMSDLGEDAGLDQAWGDLGAVVRRLHSARGDDYGWEVDYAFGPVDIPNASADDWPTFWSERRLLQLAYDLPADVARRVETVARDITGRLPDRPPASLLHGDLWTGNVIARDGRVVGLIDPACYYGHAEVDLAMLTLFATPGAAFWEAYKAEPDIAARQPIYQLWPALVHLRLFGGSYRYLVERLLTAARAD